MRAKLSLGIGILLMGFPLAAQKKAHELPKLLTSAQYVFVETVYGPLDDLHFDPRISAQDRAAVIELEKAVRSWGRYTVTLKRADADLIFVARKGKVVAANAGVNISTAPHPEEQPSTQGTSVGVGYGGEVGSPHDLLFVYARNSDGSLLGPLWQRTLDHGLDAPDMAIFQRFKDEVDAASVKQQKKKP